MLLEESKISSFITSYFATSTEQSLKTGIFATHEKGIDVSQIDGAFYRVPVPVFPSWRYDYQVHALAIKVSQSALYRKTWDLIYLLPYDCPFIAVCEVNQV